MNHNVAEVDGSEPPMLPGSFLYENVCTRIERERYQVIDKVRNRRGPRTEPWGTPDLTGSQGEETPPRTTHCSLEVR